MNKKQGILQAFFEYFPRPLLVGFVIFNSLMEVNPLGQIEQFPLLSLFSN